MTSTDLQILRKIAILQGVQKSCRYTASRWQEASAQLKALYAEMARRLTPMQPALKPRQLTERERADLAWEQIMLGRKQHAARQAKRYPNGYYGRLTRSAS